MRISRTFQNIRLFNELSVLDNVKVAYHSLAKHSVLSSMLRLPSHFLGRRNGRKSNGVPQNFELDKYKDEDAKIWHMGSSGGLKLHAH